MSISSFSQSLLPVKKNNLWGFINDSGKVIIEPQYDFVGAFGDDGLAMAKKKGVLTLIDRYGWQLAPENAREIKLLGNGNFLIKIGEEWGVMNRQKEYVVPVVYKELKVLNKQLLAARDFKNKWGCIRYNNDTVCDFFCELIYRKSNGWIQAMKGKQTICYNENGLLLFSNDKDIQILDDNYFLFREEGLWGVKNKNGDVVERARYDEGVFDIYGFVKLNRRSRSVLFSLYHGAVIADSLTNLYLVKTNIFLFANRGYKGLLHSTGKIICPPEFASFQYIGNSIMAVTPKNKWRLYNDDGTRALVGEFDQCDIYQYCNIAVIRDGAHWGVGNLSGKTLYTLGADQIKVEGLNIKIYDESKMILLLVDSLGNEVERKTYTDVSRIKIRKKRSDTNWESFALSTQNINRNDMLGAEILIGDTIFRGDWFYVNSKQKWGLRGRNGKIVIPPTFSDIMINQEKGYTIVFSTPWLPNNYSMAGYALNPTITMGVYDHLGYRYLLEPQYTSLRFQDFESGAFARCIPNYEDAKIALINLKGKTVSDDFKYIGEFKEGRARCLVGGTVVSVPKMNDSTFIDYHSYFDDLKGSKLNAAANSNYFMNMGGKWGFINASGAYDVEPLYTNVEDFKYDVAVAAVGNKWGMISNNNETVIPFQYDKISRDGEMGDSLFFATLSNDKWGILDENGKVETTALFDEISLEKNGFYQYKKGRCLGVLDSNFQLLFEDTCSRLISLKGSEFLYKRDTVWKVMDVLTKEQKVVSRQQADQARLLKIEAQWKEKKEKEFVQISPYVNGRAIVQKENLFNFIDEKGKVISKDWFEQAQDFHDNIAVVQFQKMFYKIDYDGNRMPTAYQQLRYLNHGLYLASNTLNSYIVDVNEDTLVWLNFAMDIQLDRETGVIDISGKKGLINAYADFVIAPKYADLKYMGDGKYKYKVNAFTSVFDLEGNRVIGIPAENIEVINSNLFLIETGNRIGYLKRNGEWLWPMTY